MAQTGSLRVFAGCPGKTHLYAFGFENGLTKLGITDSPVRRAKQHCASNESKLIWSHSFVPRDRNVARQVEALALRIASTAATRVGDSEWFRGLSKSDAVGILRAAYRQIQPPPPALPQPRKMTFGQWLDGKPGRQADVAIAIGVSPEELTRCRFDGVPLRNTGLICLLAGPWVSFVEPALAHPKRPS